jgi:hypothetical protein
MEETRKYKSNVGLILLFLVGILAITGDLVSYFFFHSRLWYLELLFLIIILLSGQLVYLDGKKIDAGSAYPHQRTFRARTWTPSSWSVLVIVIWIILFPYYIHKREDIYWQNIKVDYGDGKIMEREIEIKVKKKPRVDKSKYSKNVAFCPNCNSPYPIRMLEKSKYCGVCGRLLK